MTDDETTPQCRAQLHMSVHDDRFRCTRPENHTGMHQDDDGDITYVDEPGVSQQAIPFVMNVRPVQEQLTALTVRVGLLETLGARVDNLEQTSASGAATDDMFVATGKRLDALEAARTPAQPPENEAVLIDPVELGKLLEASERLSALEAEAAEHDRGAPGHVCGPCC